MKQKTAFKIYLRLFKSIKPYVGYFILSVIGLVGLAVADAVLYKYLVPYLVDTGFMEQHPEFMYKAPIYIIILFLFRGTATFIATYFMALVGRSSVRDFRIELLDKMMSLPSRYFEQTSTGKLISKVSYDTEQVASALSGAISDGIRGCFIAISMLYVMFSTDVFITSIVLLAVPVLLSLLTYVSHCVRRYSTKIQDTMGDVTKVTGEVVRGYQVIRVYDGKGYERSRVAKVMKANFIQEMKMYLASTASIPAMQFIGACALAALVYCSAIYGKHLTPGQLTGMFGAMLGMLRPIKQIASVNTVIQRGIAAAASIFKLLDEDDEVDNGTLELKSASGEIRFDNVSFKYPSEGRGDDNWVVNNIDLTIMPGQTVAVVGMSGGGKSTLLKLLLRFYDINKGSISVDGRDIKDITIASLRDQYSYVSQDFILFDDTIYNNIAYGSKFKATKEQVLQAAEAANVMEFVKDFPNGLDTTVGENGELLSGGQRQRLAIARAIVKGAPILVLDEATSALDTNSESKVQDAIANSRKGRTTIVIAHRLSTVRNADKVIVMKSGRVVESGTHSELMAIKGQYASLIASQKEEGTILA